MIIDTVYVPAGKYVIGDPCYTVPEADWIKLLESCDYFDRPIGISGGYEVLAFHTQFGDGVYRDQKRNKFPVDAGLIGLVPVEYAKIDENKLYPTQYVEFTQLTPCKREEDGTLRFGNVIIKTGTDANDYDYELDEQYGEIE